VVDEALALALRLRPAVEDERVLAAMAAVPRDRFVQQRDISRAYENVALPIACDQTISQPIVVARMLELLELTPGDRVLDIGTGSGYHAALLGLLAGEVWTVERHPELSAGAAAALAEMGCANVTCLVGDGCEGVPAYAPFDAINVAAATGTELPPALLEQLAVGGRLVAPVGARRQFLTRVRRAAGGLEREQLEPVRFVPLIPGGSRRRTST
jgi:protein-L-isoaspartate(D-aspartate) O-methyltransferase